MMGGGENRVWFSLPFLVFVVSHHIVWMDRRDKHMSHSIEENDGGRKDAEEKTFWVNLVYIPRAQFKKISKYYL